MHRRITAKAPQEAYKDPPPAGAWAGSAIRRRPSSPTSKGPWPRPPRERRKGHSAYFCRSKPAGTPAGPKTWQMLPLWSQTRSRNRSHPFCHQGMPQTTSQTSSAIAANSRFTWPRRRTPTLQAACRTCGAGTPYPFGWPPPVFFDAAQALLVKRLHGGDVDPGGLPGVDHQPLRVPAFSAGGIPQVVSGKTS